MAISNTVVLSPSTFETAKVGLVGAVRRVIPCHILELEDRARFNLFKACYMYALLSVAASA